MARSCRRTGTGETVPLRVLRTRRFALKAVRELRCQLPDRGTQGYPLGELPDGVRKAGYGPLGAACPQRRTTEAPMPSFRRSATLTVIITASLLLLGFVDPEDSERGAVYQDEPIPLADVVEHHCHDGESPTIRCFDTAAERDADAAEAVPIADASGLSSLDVLALTASSTFYVTFWQDAGYGGSSFTTSQPQPDLRDIGWNDKISSFKSLNGQRPKWFADVQYVTPSWQWAAGANVSYVGDTANDRFSSVKNVP